ncbi:alpha/beta hydrolase [Actinomycetospora lutea]|uniref:alpha/beta fold hydrolase n=1 Tax=Actinomycetospora lutea TaxID=663604 RepID=UPI0023668497|nr:alpha/beta hydrolase [Actinomycetospora lutea]MDD7941552.1 alpha/beta hydrolase [Actinomycetospora lutea]
MSAPLVDPRPSEAPGIRSSDGTWIRTWDNGAAGLPVVISNGLGAPPSAWPLLADPACGVHAVSWYHRGLDASQVPADLDRIAVEDHATDLEAVMDHAGMDRALLLGWSLGVNVAFEFARRHPERVAGILAVGGRAGDPFHILFGPTGVLHELREPLGRAGAWALRWLGPPVVAGVSATLPPVLDGTEALLALSGLRPPPGLRATSAVIREFATHPWAWYSELVLAAGDQEPMDTAFATFPVTVVAGILDNLAAADDLQRTAQSLPDARYVPLLGGHFLPLQFPGRLHQELLDLADRSDLAVRR